MQGSWSVRHWGMGSKIRSPMFTCCRMRLCGCRRVSLYICHAKYAPQLNTILKLQSLESPLSRSSIDFFKIDTNAETERTKFNPFHENTQLLF
jgi:hypothetical protein